MSMNLAFPGMPSSPLQRRPVPPAPAPAPVAPAPPPVAAPAPTVQPGTMGRRRAARLGLDPVTGQPLAAAAPQTAAEAVGINNTSGGYQPELVPGGMLEDIGGPLGDLGYDNPDALSAIWEDPTFMLPGMMPGLDPMSAGFDQVANLPFDPFSMFLAMGADMNAGPDEYAGFYQDIVGQYANGGVMPDMGALLDSIRNLDPNSTLGQAMQKNPTAAIGFMKAAIGQAAKTSMNPLAASMVNNGLSGMFAPVLSESMRLSPNENVPGAIDATAALNAGLARLGLG